MMHTRGSSSLGFNILIAATVDFSLLYNVRCCTGPAILIYREADARIYRKAPEKSRHRTPGRQM